jgi:hypothetical protein
VLERTAARLRRTVGLRLAHVRGMDEVSAASSAECIDALWQLGFAIVETDEHCVWLEGERDHHRVFIERNRVLSPEAIRLMVAVAHVPLCEFLTTLQRRRAARELCPVDVPGLAAVLVRKHV